MQNNYSYKLTPLALQDIDETLAYITEKLLNGKAAINLLDELEHTLNSICSYPHAFPDCAVFMITDTMIRHAPVNNYLLIYEIDEEEKQVNILRFLYAKADIANMPTGKRRGE